MTITKKYLNDLTYKVTGCAIEVHKHLGPGLLESVYEKCFLRELTIRGIENKNQLWVPVQYKGLELNTELRLDVLIEDILCVELKAQEVFCQYMTRFSFHICRCYTNLKVFSSIFIV
jgi:GxxExxY protein